MKAYRSFERLNHYPQTVMTSMVMPISIFPFSTTEDRAVEIFADGTYNIEGIRMLSAPGEFDITKIVKQDGDDESTQNPWLSGPIDASVFSISVAGSWRGGAHNLDVKSNDDGAIEIPYVKYPMGEFGNSFKLKIFFERKLNALGGFSGYIVGRYNPDARWK